MELREYIKKYQGKCYKYENSRDVMYMRIVKIGKKMYDSRLYYGIYDFITYSIIDKDWEMHTEDTEIIDLDPPEMYGWERTTKSDFKTAKRRYEKATRI